MNICISPFYILIASFVYLYFSCSSRENSPNTQKTPDSGHVSQDPKSDNSSNQSSPEVLTTAKNRCVWQAGCRHMTWIYHRIRAFGCSSCVCVTVGLSSAAAACWMTVSHSWDKISLGCAGEWLIQGVVLISVAGPHPSPRVMTSPAPPPTLAALPVWWRRMKQRWQRTMTQAWWVGYSSYVPVRQYHHCFFR